MKTLVNNLAFRHAYQGFFLLLMIAIPNITLGMTTLYNNQTGLTFTKLESWGVIAINLIIFYLTYLWAKSEGLMTRFRLDLKDAKAIIWGFLTIFLMGVIGSNLATNPYQLPCRTSKDAHNNAYPSSSHWFDYGSLPPRNPLSQVDFHLVSSLFENSCASQHWALLSLSYAN